jgi:hypothetical protein
MAQSVPPALPTYKHNFLQSCLSAKVLTFGTYTLKSGRGIRIPLTQKLGI